MIKINGYLKFEKKKVMLFLYVTAFHLHSHTALIAFVLFYWQLHFTDAEIRSNALAVISAVKSHRVAKKGKDTLDDLKQRDVVTGCM